MLTFVINLDRDAARLTRIETLFGERGISFIRVPAVDARALSQEERDAASVYPEPVSIRLTPGEIGCYMSHIKAWRMLLESGAERAAIFEDDVDISRDAANALAAIDAWMPGDADVVKLETSLKPAELERGSTLLSGDRQIRRLAGCHIGAAGYVISRKAAARMLSESDRLKMAVDTMLFDPRGGIAGSFVLYQLSPAMCIQTRLQTDDEPAIESTIKTRADRKSYGASLPEKLRNRLADRLAYARRRIGNLARGARAISIPFKP